MNDKYNYYNIILNIPINALFTYKSRFFFKIGTRVSVNFNKKMIVGIIAEINPNVVLKDIKILEIEKKLDEENFFTEEWLELIKFCANYYHYPIGKTTFNILPKDLKNNKSIHIPKEELSYSLIRADNNYLPSAHHKKLSALWMALQKTYLSEEEVKKIHPKAMEHINKWHQVNLIDSKKKSENIDYQKKVEFTSEQEEAIKTISKQINNFQVFLLYGITGSGKTEIYLDVIYHVLKQGKQILYLIPEINLTTQLIERIHNNFLNANIAILNSQIANKEREKNFLNARFGFAQIIIGTRLAIFTPISNLGLIIVDEEHDNSFKQENDLRYNARDLAVFRAKRNQCPVILGSATPSLESWYNIKDKNYQLVKLTHRAKANSLLPEIKLVDIKNQKLNNEFAYSVLNKIKDNFIEKGTTLIYLNRRGYAPVLMCFECRFIVQCPNCSSYMVFHQKAKQLKCHHCDFQTTVPTQCPLCKTHHLSSVGSGTQKVEETLTLFLPEAKIARIDKDNTSRKNDWKDFYQSINEEKIDIIIGTQMMSKGYDFKNLNLIIVLNIDSALYSNSFRITEHLFTEMMQVSGRAGRDKKRGRVLIQTQFPEHPIFSDILAQNYEKFVAKELINREKFDFPPYIHVILIKAESLVPQLAKSFLKECKKKLDELKLTSLKIYGPVEPSLLKLAGKERYQIFLESNNRKILHQNIQDIHSILTLTNKKYKQVRWFFDVDPYEE